MDEIDRKILTLLQKRCDRSLAEIGDAVGLSSTPLWRRIRNLEESGIIRGRVALLDPQKVGCALAVFVTLRTRDHSTSWLTSFSGTVALWPEVSDFYRLSGSNDFILKVRVADVPAFDRFYKKLVAIDGVGDISTAFALEEIKHSTVLPV